MQSIKKVGVVSLAKIMGVIYAFFGLVVGSFVCLTKLLNIQASGEASQLQSVGYFAIILFPVIYGLIGAISGVASGFFFNKAVEWVGPLEVKIVQASE